MIDFEGDATQNEKQPLPDGDYFLTVKDAAEKKSKTSGRDMIEMELIPAVGPFEGKKPFKHWLTFIEAGSDGHGMTLHALHAFGFQHDGHIRVNGSDFIGRTVKAKVSSEEYKGRLNNKIVDFYILDDQQMAAEGREAAQSLAETGAAEPDSAPSKPAPAAKPAGRKLPWAK